MKCLLFISLTVFWLHTASQPLPASTIQKVDSLFSKWNHPGSPGCAVGIIRNDSLIYAKGYGMANLEYPIPIGATTPFHMASISKQFTGYAIMLLAKQGKLKLDDEIYKYLPWFPKLGKITIQHLLNHSSGIRDQWQLLAISGTRLDDVITQEHIVKILSKQQALNFAPNEQHSYSNSGYTMLAEIVKAVSGKTLRQFTDSAIFKPLGMSHTHFHDDYTEVEEGRSYSYDRKDSAHFSNSVLSYSNAGATSLFTTLEDLSKWVIHFYDHPREDDETLAMLTKKSKLNDGKELNYANGIVVDTYKGWRQLSHGGADAGYRTYLTVMPDRKMGFLVFSNLGDVNVGGLAYGVADLFIKDSSNKAETSKAPGIDSTLGVLKDSMHRFQGNYIGEEGLDLNLKIKEGKLFYHIFEEGLLTRQTKDTFLLAEDPTVKFVFKIAGKDTVTSIVTADHIYVLKKYIKDTSWSSTELKQYVGRFYSPELDCTYGIELKNQKLFLTNNKYPDAEISLVGTDHLLNGNWWIQHLVILRDSKKAITGFEVNSGRIMHLRFNKVLR